jgi:hypothetical protein
MMIQILQDLYPLDLTPKNHFEPIVKDDCWIDVKALLDRVPLIWSER